MQDVGAVASTSHQLGHSDGLDPDDDARHGAYGDASSGADGRNGPGGDGGSVLSGLAGRLALGALFAAIVMGAQVCACRALMAHDDLLMASR